MVIFRENTEDIYAGIDFAAGSPEASAILATLADKMPREFKKVRFGTPEAGKVWGAAIGHPDLYAVPEVGVGIKPVSRAGSERLIWAAIEFALKHNRRSVTLVHKGNIMKFTEGAFKDWGYALARSSFRARCITERESWILGNREANPDLTPEASARLLDPGFDMMTLAQPPARQRSSPLPPSGPPR